MALGATLGSALDGIHTHFGATSYTTPLFAQAAWWTPLLFGGAFAAGVVRPLLDPSPRPATWKVLLCMSLFVGAYWLTVAPIPWPARAAILFGLFGAGYWLCDRTRVGLAIAAFVALLGPLVEVALVRAGTFIHHENVALGIPGWLPFLYLTGSVGLSLLAKWLVDPADP